MISGYRRISFLYSLSALPIVEICVHFPDVEVTTDTCTVYLLVCFSLFGLFYEYVAGYLCDRYHHCQGEKK